MKIVHKNKITGVYTENYQIAQAVDVLLII